MDAIVPMTLAFGFTFEEFYSQEGLQRLDETFLGFLEAADKELFNRLIMGRQETLASIARSALLIDLAPHVEDFFSQLFNIKQDINQQQREAYRLAPLYQCKRQFVQRRAEIAYSKEEALTFDGQQLKETIVETIGSPYSDLSFAEHVLEALEKDNQEFLDLALKFAAWSLHQSHPSVLFRLPKKIDPENLVTGNAKPELVTLEKALDQVKYCIFCHEREKDTCSKGQIDVNKGCPLEQKISEMNVLRSQGYALGALAIIMIDNPMVAATGRRICNDCMKACIFQKQDPVDIPSIETQTLDSVLELPWGVEIYCLLSRWNPLNLEHPLPQPETGYKVMVAGMGPAGFTLAHYLLNAGHTVTGVDGLKIDPLDHTLLKPIKHWSDIKESQDERKPQGFGGVAEYGITARWDKNYLTLVRLLLERRKQFSLYDNVRIGGTLTIEQIFDLGFDHLALCLGAGQPNTMDIPNMTARGVRMASDFLMALQLSDTQSETSITNLQIRMPALVIGAGLTAVDAATEILNYYPKQIQKFKERFESLDKSALSKEEQEIAEEFLQETSDPTSSIVYRKRMQDSPSYRLNAEELDLAIGQGVGFIENAIPEEIIVDKHNHIKALKVQTSDGAKELPCRTLLIATGTHPNRILETEEPDLKIEGDEFYATYQANEKVSYFGDLNPAYNGNVVKAMASAKHGYHAINKALLKTSPKHVHANLDELLEARIDSIYRLTPTILEFLIKAPQAARNFRPGQFYRLQNYGSPALEGLALTGASVEGDLLSLIILELGGSSELCQHLKPGERVALMGPTGTPTEIPKNETLLLIGGGLGNAVLFSIGKTLKENGNKVIYLAGYKSPQDRFKVEDIEAVSDHVIWCCENAPGIQPNRPQDYAFKGHVIDGLMSYCKESPAIPLSQVNRIITIGSDGMMAAVMQARKTILKPYLKDDHKAICSLNAPMQCMMKGICGQCIQTLVCPETGEEQVIFSCINQDQSMDEVDFEVLQNRLKQNSLLEKQTKAWLRNVQTS